MLAALVLTGCAGVRNAVPPDLLTKAHITGMPNIRSFAYTKEEGPVQKSLIESMKQEKEGEYSSNWQGVKYYPVLAISGGSANGAYGAGVLKGWSESGTRPKFKVVTGVSTGALTAPFAFLGSDYDKTVEDLYTTTSTKDVMAGKGPVRILIGDSLASNSPLARKISSMIKDDLLMKIAEEHKKGRRLFVGTMNLDAQRFVIWDMGAIASLNTPESKKLFERVLLASAAIPVAFPPVMFKVEADGKFYDEMHVDGGTGTQVFGLYGLTAGLRDIAKSQGLDPEKIKGSNYVIRNGFMSLRYQPVKDDLVSISSRAIDTLTDTQAVGDVYRLYTYAKKRGVDFNLAYIPEDFVPHNKEQFDKKEMNRLFERGYLDAKNGYKWHKEPPGLEVPEIAVSSRGAYTDDTK